MSINMTSLPSLLPGSKAQPPRKAQWQPETFESASIRTTTRKGAVCSVPIAYRLTKAVAESGPLCIVVHGIGDHSYAGSFIYDALVKAGFDTLCYDQPGRGHSAHTPTFDYSGVGHCNVLRGLLEYLGMIKRDILLFAHSMGGAIATMYADMHPGQVAGLFLLSPAGLMPSAQFKVLKNVPNWMDGCFRSMLVRGQAKAQRDSMYQATNNSLFEWMCENHNVIDKHNSTIRALLLSAKRVPMSGQTPMVSRVAADSRKKSRPVWILWGDKDKMVPYKPCFKRWAACFENDEGSDLFQTRVYEDAGHAFHLEDGSRDDVTALAVEFAKRSSKSR